MCLSAESNKLISEYETKFGLGFDSVSYLLLRARYENYMNLNNYKETHAAAIRLLSDCKNYLDSAKRVGLEDDLLMFSHLVNEPAMSVQKTGDSKLKITKDLAGLWNIDVTSANDTTTNLVFDTGANLSVVMESVAKKLGFRELPNSSFRVMTSTGNKVNATLAIADKIKMDHFIACNVVFIVVPDSVLTFANGAYKLNGAIGYPVIKGMGQFTVNDSTMFVPAKNKIYSLEPNLFVVEDEYVLSLEYNGKKLPFMFDSGGNSSTFNHRFYLANKDYFDKIGKPAKVTLGGAGGSRTFSSIQIDSLILTCESKKIQFDKVELLTEINEGIADFYGNMGKDLIEKFKSTTFCFDQSLIIFE